MRSAALLLLLLATTVTGCRTGRNYAAAEVPRYHGGPVRDTIVVGRVDTIDVVAFNIKYARRIDRVLELFRSVPELDRADVLLLNEMDESGTWRIADALGMHYVYYPAVLHRRTGRDFGNAVLSRWPIVDDEVILLPHTARFQKTQRTATAATIRIGHIDVRVYATHLGTFFEIGPGARREQLETILADAARYTYAIIGGDINDGRLGSIVDEHGFTWPTQRGPKTMPFGRLDHIFLKNLPIPDSAGAGTVVDVRGASDHRPVWARAIIRLH